MLPLAGTIRRARELHSLTSDLVMAVESLDALDALLKAVTEAQDFGRMITANALLVNALILYARATKTSSDERRGFDLTSRFSPEQRAVHKELCDLRDCAIAHFGSGGSYNGIWQAERVILQFRGAESKPAVATRRKAVDTSLATRARRQIELARDLLRALSEEQIEKITDEISQTLLRDPDFFDNEIVRHPLNFDIFMASPDAANLARASFDRGYSKGIVNE